MNDTTHTAAILPFPADSDEYEEYSRVMDELSDIAHDSAPDPTPDNFGGMCEDAPCCGCCGQNDIPMDNDNDYIDNAPDDSYLDMDTDDQYEGGEDSYLDASWEDANEYGMDGCCGDF